MSARDTFEFMDRAPRGRFGDGDAAPRPTAEVRSDLVDLTLNFMMDKPLSIAVTDPATIKGRWVWLPKSRIEFERNGTVVKVSVPEWLAKEKGLI